jgi:hypothetical protein
MEKETLEARLSAVERAVTDEDSTPHRADVSSRLDEIEARLRDLEAATQALRGYVGEVRERDDRAERQADGPLADVNQVRPRDREYGMSTRAPTRPDGDHWQDSEDSATGLLDRMVAWL